MEEQRKAEERRLSEEFEAEKALTSVQGGEIFRLRATDFSKFNATGQEAEFRLEREREADAKKIDLFFSRAKQDKNFARLDFALKGGVSSGLRFNLTDMSDSMKPYLLAALMHADKDRKFLLIVPDELTLRAYSQEFLNFNLANSFGEFRARELEFLSLDAVSRDLEFKRLEVLRKLRQADSRLIIATAASVSQRLADFNKTESLGIELKVGDRLDFSHLRYRLSALGFEIVKVCSEAGQMAVRGEIIDIVPVDDLYFEFQENEANDKLTFSNGDNHISDDKVANLAEKKVSSVESGIRISFFDDEIERIDRFELNTQRSIAPLDSYTIYPQREVILDENEWKNLISYLDARAKTVRKEKIKNGASLAEADKWASLYLRDKERAEARELFPGLDRYLNIIYPDAESIISIADKLNYVILCDEPIRLRQRLDALNSERMLNAENYWERKEAPEEIGAAFFNNKDVFTQINQCQKLLSFASLLSSGNGFPNAENIKLSGRESESRLGLERQMIEEFKERKNEAYLSLILCPDKMRRDKLRELIWNEAPEIGDITLPLALSHGFDYRAAGLYAMSSDELFGHKSRHKRKRKKKARSITLFTDLKIGELLVHDVYGIGIYRGLSQIEQGGSRRDFIEIEYAGNDKLYIPMDALDQIQKYIGGGDKDNIKLSKLGGSEWEKAKSKARDSIRQLATNLISLYAQRRDIKGFAFSKDSPWAKDFADSFEYQETDDQLQAIDEINADMESSRVMDRLLCGDVGFGKTEVAFRALFKAAADSKQAAFLAPTTVLSQQHYENFKRRLGDFPLRVALLNRFVPNVERNKIIRAIRRGEIDIVIGTHRLLSKDVEFKDLGLLVIDEEQRFGVDHKEGLKERYPEVDVLSLSATPIPRTLHMSLSGIRDISVIEEAPENRRPVRTYVMDYDISLISEAIMREINRQGQVFYLFNNVKEMERECAKIQEQIPNARILLGHGQMPEHQLEEVIESFMNKEADILLCTTIIESGIDMPNVNTLIVTNSDKFGLSQLYQIKGRVGRSTRQAYAYFTYQKDKILTEEAEKRLTALKEYTELGSGLKIALKDLEVRGAGNLLGAEQHGQMAAIGYDLYCRMLDEEIQYAKDLAELERVKERNNSAELFSTCKSMNGEIDRTAARSGETSSKMGEPSSRMGVDESGNKSIQASQVKESLSPFDMKNRTKAVSLETLVDLDIDAYISSDYISDDTSRVDVYRRIVKIENYEDYLDLQDEFIDRFGDPPEALNNLLNVSYVRARASLLGIEKISRKKAYVLLSINKNRLLHMEGLSSLMGVKAYQKNLQLDMGSSPCIKVFNIEGDDVAVIDELRKIFYASEKELKSQVVSN